MKKSDIAMIILIASVSVMVSFAIANQISFLKLPEKGDTVKTTTPISSSVESPDSKVFNSNAINPTIQTVIGGDQASQ